MWPVGFVYVRSLESRVFLAFGAGRLAIIDGNASATSEAGEESSDPDGCEFGVPERGPGGDWLEGLLRMACIAMRSPIVAWGSELRWDGEDAKF